jgi:hypothetical protein
MSTSAASYRRDQAFFLRLAAGISLLVVFAFAQWALRGFADYATAPPAVHVHGIVMLGWLALFVTQNHLAGRGSLRLHRRLGWAGAVLAAFMVYIGTVVTLEAIALQRVPPIFTTPYFLVLGPVHLAGFALLLALAISLRRQTEWHRRLMLVATVVLIEPAFGRLLPPAVMTASWGAWVEGGLQAALLGIAMLHDRRVRGAVHPALWLGVIAVFLCVLTVQLLAEAAPVVACAEKLAAGG